MKTFLFQGDSITDSGRNREWDEFAGWGYPTLIAGDYTYNHPGEYKFINRGIGGNRSIDVLERMQPDIIDLKPDYMSLLVGVNDVWHELDWHSGVSAEKGEQVLTELFDGVMAALPDLKVFLLEPFILPSEINESRWDIFESEVTARSEMVQRIAEKFGFPFIPLQDKLWAAQKTTPDDPRYWLVDGVHPTAAGHLLIAKALVECFEKNK